MAILTFMVTAAAVSHSVQAAVPSAEPSDSTVHAVSAAPPRVDGFLDDAVWQLAVPVTRFTQRDPIEGAPATFATEARVLYSEHAFYIGIRAHDPDPRAIMAPLAARDDRPHGDWLGVMIDSYYDRRTAFEFAVNAAGVRHDAYRFDDFEVDASWDAVWDAKVQRDSLGWSAELRIPLSQLRFIPGPGLRFGFNVYREVGRTREVQYWRLLSKQDRSVVSRFGDLVGLADLPAPARWEISPYMTARSGTGAGHTVRTGIDARIAPSRGLTVTAAVNPDFGQVEADPTVVNLTALETFYPERRPLFVEDLDLFRLPLNPDTLSSESLLYTRRIGRAPQLGASDASDPATILGAVKVVRRTGTGWSLASLAAVTAREHVPVASGGAQTRALAEPATLYGAFRLSRDVHAGRSQLATFATLSLRESSPEPSSLRSQAGAGGVSLSYRPHDGPYLARALVAVSHVAGSAAAISATQRSAVHYFQRPDQQYARFDSSRTSLTGTAAWLELARDRGATTARLRMSSLSPGLEVNDLGFLSQSGIHAVRGTATHRWLERTHFREAAVHVESFWDADWGGRTSSRGAGLRVSGTTNGYWSFAAEAWRALGGAETTVLHGGPALERAGNNFFRFDARTSQQRALRAGITLVQRPFDEALAHEKRAGASLTWRPAANLEAELTPSYEWNHYRHQYVGTASLFGEPRYVVGWLHQESVRVGLRANLTFTPSLSLEGYAEALSTTGQHREFYEVADPAARARADRLRVISESSIQRSGTQLAFDLDGNDSADLSVPTPDFAILSLRSTIVLRWEFRPGSDLSLVVQQHGTETAIDSSRDPLRALRRVRSLPHRTLGMLKLNYWLSL